MKNGLFLSVIGVKGGVGASLVTALAARSSKRHRRRRHHPPTNPLPSKLAVAAEPRRTRELTTLSHGP